MEQQYPTMHPSSSPPPLSSSPSTLPSKKWSWKEILSIIFLILFPPIGIILMWIIANWSTKTKIIITVIWIGVILISILLATMESDRAEKRGNDARIIAQMAQIRTGAEMYYGFDGRWTFIGLSCATVMPVNMTHLCADIDNQNRGRGGEPVFTVTDDHFCVGVALATTGNYFCVDSVGRSMELDVNPQEVGHPCRDTENPRCVV